MTLACLFRFVATDCDLLSGLLWGGEGRETDSPSLRCSARSLSSPFFILPSHSFPVDMTASAQCDAVSGDCGSRDGCDRD